MRILCLVLICITFISQSFAEAETVKTKNPVNIKLIYKQGHLINIGEEALLSVEIVSPFYRYLGDILKEEKINVSDIKTKFTVQYTIRAWIGEYETMSETFIPTLDSRGPDVGLDVKVCLEDKNLFIKVTSVDKITDIFIEILQDIPIKISEDRVRYTLSSVGIMGQNLKRGPEAKFKLYLLTDQDFYKVPIQITYVFQGSLYDKIFTFSFKKEYFLK
ncbi:hypothetical protein ACFL2G_04780 [Candidatus Omnitrophota bacterium]